jgi:iron complex transport system substrate-binding protein
MRLYLLFIVLFMCANAHAIECEAENPVSEYKPHYAQFFSIRYYKNFKLVNSMKDQFIVGDKKNLGCVTKLPVITGDAQRFIATSTTHLPFLKMLSLEKFLVGFTGVRYIYNPDLRKQNIKDISYQMNPEEILSLKPDLVMAYSANLSSGKRLAELRKLNIPVVLNHDFEEKHPLARAEWMVFSATFFAKDEDAQKIFQDIENNYVALKSKSGMLKNSPLVLVGEIQNGKWAICGGESDLSILIQDAGGKLLLKTPSSETQFISLEKMLTLKNSPDVWLTQNTWVNAKAAQEDSRYKKFSGIKKYNNNKKLNADGFSDFWEKGVSRPDLLLKDLYAIIHQQKELMTDLIWYREIK